MVFYSVFQEVKPMDIREAIQPFIKPDLILFEQDFTEDENWQLKTQLTESDRHIDYSQKTQKEKGGIVAPSYETYTLKMLGKTLHLRNELKGLGNGAWELRQTYGTISRNESDRLRLKTPPRSHSQSIFFLHSEREGYFKKVSEEHAKKEAQKAWNLLFDDDIARFVLHYDRDLFPMISGKADTFNDRFFEKQRENVRHFHELLIALGVISQATFRRIDSALDQTDRAYLIHLFKRSYWVDGRGDEVKLYPSIGEIYAQRKTDALFRTPIENRLLEQWLKEEKIVRDDQQLVRIDGDGYTQFKTYMNNQLGIID
jgi:hypothetical protein